MSPTVLLLLSILIKALYGCQDFEPLNVRDLLNETKENQHTGFKQVFPTNYYVSHRYNTSILCNDNPCCVLPAAYVLRDSWSQLLRHLDQNHYKYKFITRLIDVLKKMTEDKRKFQETPDLFIFRPVSSSPDELLSFTVHVLERWEELKCPSSLSGCAFPTAAPEQDEDEEDLMAFRGVEENAVSRPFPEPEREGERGRRRSMTAAPTNVGCTRQFHFAGLTVWSLSLLWIALDS